MPDHIRQSTNELRGCVAVALERLFVDHLADGEPEGRFEALGWVSLAEMNMIQQEMGDLPLVPLHLGQP